MALKPINRGMNQLLYMRPKTPQARASFSSILFLGMLTLVVSACSGTKAYYKKALKLEEAGMLDEAVSMYLISLQKKSSNVDAQIQLKQTGTRVMDELWADFYIAYTAEEHKKAVYSYKEANALNDRINRYVKIDRPAYYEDYFEEAKEAYMDELYVDAQELLAAEKFQSANALFNEISALDPTYKDVHDMRMTSKAEPIFRQAEEAMFNNDFRDAYYLYSDVVQVSSSYKDAKSKMAEAIDKASFTIAIMPLEGSETSAELTNKFYSLITEELLSLNSPFIKVIDRSLTDQILAEQKLALSGLVDENTAAKAGKLIGSKAVLSGSLINMKTEQSAPKATVQQGYEAYRIKKFNKTTGKSYYETKYRKTNFTEVVGSIKVEGTFQFKLVSSETGEILVSDVVMKENRDELNFATFKGNASDLYPGYYKFKNIPSPADKVFVDPARKRALEQKLSNERRKLRSEESMKLQLMEYISSNIAAKINVYEKAR